MKLFSNQKIPVHSNPAILWKNRLLLVESAELICLFHQLSRSSPCKLLCRSRPVFPSSLHVSHDQLSIYQDSRDARIHNISCWIHHPLATRSSQGARFWLSLILYTDKQSRPIAKQVWIPSQDSQLCMLQLQYVKIHCCHTAALDICKSGFAGYFRSRRNTGKHKLAYFQMQHNFSVPCQGFCQV